ncbi:hypothetical protein ACH4SP_22990 [Streptomyces sp. NPDC021093]|uniref:hypothetical protein n=1 Tax=Streptomyces sp. NPDC021093 TaxID=3365112 RepID=UPI00378E1364
MRNGAGYLKGLYRSVVLFLPLLPVFVLSQIIWHSDTATSTKILSSLGMLGVVLLLSLVHRKVFGPPVGVDEVEARYRSRLLGPGERLKLVVPVREAVGRLPYSMLGHGLGHGPGLWLACTDRRVVAFSYDRKGGGGVAPLWSAESGGVALRGGRVVLPDGVGGQRKLVVAPGVRGDVEYWLDS